MMRDSRLSGLPRLVRVARAIARGALGLSLSIVLVVDGAALAKDGDATREQGQDQVTQVTAHKDSSFTLTLPARTTIPFGARETELEGVLSVTGNVAVGERVDVSVSPGELRCAQHGGTIPYELQAMVKGKPVRFSGETWSADEVNGATKEFAFAVAISQEDWDRAQAGSYAGTIMFRARISGV